MHAYRSQYRYPVASYHIAPAGAIGFAPGSPLARGRRYELYVVDNGCSVVDREYHSGNPGKKAQKPDARIRATRRSHRQAGQWPGASFLIGAEARPQRGGLGAVQAAGQPPRLSDPQARAPFRPGQAGQQPAALPGSRPACPGATRDGGWAQPGPPSPPSPTGPPPPPTPPPPPQP